MLWYYKLLAHRPHLILLFIGTLCTACIIVSLTTKKLPDFSDPTLGFEARGTELGQRMSAWHNLLDETKPSGSGMLVTNPYEYLNEEPEMPRRKGGRKYNQQRHRNKKKKKGKNKSSLVLTEKIQVLKNANQKATSGSNSILSESGDGVLNAWVEEDNSINNQTLVSRKDSDPSMAWEYGRNVSFIDDDDDDVVNRTIQMKKDNWMKLTKAQPPPFQVDIHTSTDGFFCESPNNGYSHFVMERINHNLTESLFEINGLLAMCDLEQQIATTDHYEEFCVRQVWSNECCRPWSIPNYVALLSNRTHCYDLQPEDVVHVQQLLTSCFPYYHDLRLDGDCVTFRCKNVPLECAQFNSVYNIFHYLADNKFMTVNVSIGWGRAIL